MDVMTNGEAGEGKEKSIMEMIAAGDFDAGSDDPPTNDTTGQQDGEDVQMEEVPIKEENKVAEEADKETADEVKTNGGDVEIKKEKDGEDAEGASAAANAGEEVTSGDDDKYTKEDTPRRIFVKHIDRKKNADDIEDYFFDNYKDSGLEDVYTCTVFNARSQRRMFFGNVILTFDT